MVATPDGLRTLDVVGSDVDCERWVELRAASDDSFSVPRTIDDIRNDHRAATKHGRATLVAADDIDFGAIIRTYAPGGDAHLYINITTDGSPAPRLLRSAIDRALAQAREDDVVRLHTSAERQRWTYDVLVDDLEFRDAEQWLQFHRDLDGSEGVELPAGCTLRRLHEHPELGEAAHRLYQHGLDDMPGDFPRASTTVDAWLDGLDASPTTGRDHITLVVDADGTAVAVTRIVRRAAGVPFGDIGMVSTAREHRGKGFARIARAAALQLAWDLGITRLDTFTRSDNTAIIHLCRTQGWVERERVHYLERDL